MSGLTVSSHKTCDCTQAKVGGVSANTSSETSLNVPGSSSQSSVFTPSQASEVNLIIRDMLKTPLPQMQQTLQGMVNAMNPQINTELQTQVNLALKNYKNISYNAVHQSTQAPRWIGTALASIDDQIKQNILTTQESIMTRVMSSVNTFQDTFETTAKNIPNPPTCDQSPITCNDATKTCTINNMTAQDTLYIPGTMIVQDLRVDSSITVNGHAKVSGELMVNDAYCCSGSQNQIQLKTPAPAGQSNIVPVEGESLSQAASRLAQPV